MNFGRCRARLTRLLTRRLRELEALGVIERRAVLAPPNGSGVEYRLTDAGRSVVPIFDAVDAFLNTPEAEIFAPR